MKASQDEEKLSSLRPPTRFALRVRVHHARHRREYAVPGIRAEANAVQLAGVNGFVAPYWVQLVQSENTFREFASVDGVNWTQVGSIDSHDDQPCNRRHSSNSSSLIRSSCLSVSSSIIINNS